MGNVSFNFLFRKGYGLHTKNWQYHINDRSHLLKVVSILHVCIFYEACLQQKSTLGSLRYRDYGLRLRLNMLLRMIQTT